MAGLPGLAEAVARKYELMQQEADSRARLSNAQADAIPSTTASENALRGAQAFQTTQQGQEVAPLAQSQITEAAARGGLYGAQGRLADVTGRVTGLGLSPASDPFARALGAGFRKQGVFGDGSLPAPGAAPTSNPVPEPEPTVTDDHARTMYNNHPMVTGVGGVGGAAQIDVGGNTGVAGGSFAPQAFTNTGRFEFSGGDQLDPRKEPGALGFKKGTPNVKAGGKGGGKGLAGLMASLGAGGAGPQAPMPMSPMASPMAGGAPAPGPQTMQPMGMMAGTPKVPGVGSGNVDKVPAMLAPHEAVLTHGAADALGRAKIAKLNAQHPPTPGRGAPPPNAKKPPLRRGMV